METKNSVLNFDYKNHPEFISYYKTHRNKVEDLYPSERHFIQDLAPKALHVLDVGCAAGGFSNIWKHFNPHIIYIGVDQSEALIDRARALYPQDHFFAGDFLQNPDNSFSIEHPFDIVSALGVMSWNIHWDRVLQAMWNMTRYYCLFDVRIAGSHKNGYQEAQLDPDREWDHHIAAPYIVVSYDELYAHLDALKPRPVFIQQYGYWRNPSPTAHEVPEQVLVQTIVLKKEYPMRPAF